VHSDPRFVAGQPLTAEILKCAMKSVDAGDYTPRLTSAQVARLRQVFPDGVCDWSKPGPGASERAGIWQRFR
jgi:hypothetical protein